MHIFLLPSLVSSQAKYCSSECQKAHWKAGRHKTFCKGMKATLTFIDAAEKKAAATASSSQAGGDCIICLDKDSRPIQSGCGCRGDAGLAHIACRVTVAEHAVPSERSDAEGGVDEWHLCSTCGHPFLGAMALGLAIARWRHAQRLPETNWERVHAAMRLGSTMDLNMLEVDAEPILRYAMAAAKRTFGNDDPVVLQAASFLSVNLRCQKKAAEADALDRHCHKESVRLHGPDHEMTVEIAKRLAQGGLSAQGQANDAIAEHKKSLSEHKRAYGSEHLLTLGSVGQLGHMLLSLQTLEGLDEAEALYAEHLPIMKRVLGPEHIITLMSIAGYARCFACDGRFAEAEAMYAELLPVAERVLGAEHPLTGSTSNMLTNMRRALGRGASA